MKIQLDCPHAKHGNLMRVYCDKQNGSLCMFQFFRNCKGWWVNSPAAAQCPIRKEGKEDAEQNAET